MSMFKVNVVARNTKDESLVSLPTEVLVDTGAELTWLPKDLLTGINIKPVRKRNFTTATKQIVTRETGYAILSAEGFETVDEVVFAEPSDMALLGVRTLEGFGVMVDNIAHRFVATTTLVAPLPAETWLFVFSCLKAARSPIDGARRGNGRTLIPGVNALG